MASVSQRLRTNARWSIIQRYGSFAGSTLFKIAVAAAVPTAATAAVPTPTHAAVDRREDEAGAFARGDGRDVNCAARLPPIGPRIAPSLIAEFAYS